MFYMYNIMANKRVFSFTMVADFFKDAINQLQRGENSYQSDNIKTMTFNREVKPAILKGTVAASMKKITYSVEVSIDIEDDIILDVSCTCPRGLVKCHHIAALCIHAHHNVRHVPGLYHELYLKRKLYTAICSEVPEDNIKKFDSILGQGNVVGYSWLLRPQAEIDIENILPSVENLFFSEYYLQAVDKKLYITEKLRLTQDKIIDVQEKTIGQANNENLLIARKNRLTASNFGAVLNAIKRQRYPPSLFKRLMDGYDLSLAMAVQWGKEHEAIALSTFSAAFQNLEVTPTGLWLDESGFLGASPDGLCGDSGIVEVKCPYKFRDCSLAEALKHDKTYIIYKETDETIVNGDHVYYHQIQGQLYLTKRDICYLVIWTPNECEVIYVSKDKDREVNLEMLRSFYIDTFIPFISGMNK